MSEGGGPRKVVEVAVGERAGSPYDRQRGGTPSVCRVDESRQTVDPWSHGNRVMVTGCDPYRIPQMQIDTNDEEGPLRGSSRVS